MTVVHSPEDQETIDLLRHYGRITVPNVTWNWVPVEKSRLFRRAIGRNLRAKGTTADWIFFTDCDQMFYRDALDALAAEVTLDRPGTDSFVPEINTELFHPVVHHKAVGGLQLVHGDVARAVGYCEGLPFYQTPRKGFGNTYEDRAFRWLLGTSGVPIEVPHIYRIEHHLKGRYESRRLPAWLRPLLSSAGRADLMAKRRRSDTSSSGPQRRAA
jgi:hypothetical protein